MTMLDELCTDAELEVAIFEEETEGAVGTPTEMANSGVEDAGFTLDELCTDDELGAGLELAILAEETVGTDDTATELDTGNVEETGFTLDELCTGVVELGVAVLEEETVGAATELDDTGVEEAGFRLDDVGRLLDVLEDGVGTPRFPVPRGLGSGEATTFAAFCFGAGTSSFDISSSSDGLMYSDFPPNSQSLQLDNSSMGCLVSNLVTLDNVDAGVTTLVLASRLTWRGK
jgi:hypothetical protein